MFTDKLVAKIPSTASGIVTKINYADDTICSVGHPIMTIETEDGEDAASPMKQQPAASQSSNSFKSDTEMAAGKICPLTDKSNDNVSE